MTIGPDPMTIMLRWDMLERLLWPGGVPSPGRLTSANLRLKAPLPPKRAFALVFDPVVETIGAALPEFEAIRCDEIAAPGVRARHLFLFEALLEVRVAIFERFARVDRLALLRGPGREA